MKSPNNAIQLTTDPRHASCLRTCRATGPLQLIADVRQERRCLNTCSYNGESAFDEVVGPSMIARGCTSRRGRRTGLPVRQPARLSVQPGLDLLFEAQLRPSLQRQIAGGLPPGSGVKKRMGRGNREALFDLVNTKENARHAAEKSPHS